MVYVDNIEMGYDVASLHKHITDMSLNLGKEMSARPLPLFDAMSFGTRNIRPAVDQFDGWACAGRNDLPLVEVPVATPIAHEERYLAQEQNRATEFKNQR